MKKTTRPLLNLWNLKNNIKKRISHSEDIEDKIKKILIPGLVLSLISGGIIRASSPLPESITEILPLIEQKLSLKDSPISRNIPYESLSSVFDKYCSPESIQKGEILSENIYQTIEEELSNNLQFRILFFKRYKDYILNIWTGDQEQFCQQKVAGYTLLHNIQKEKSWNGIIDTHSIKKNQKKKNHKKSPQMPSLQKTTQALSSATPLEKINTFEKWEKLTDFPFKFVHEKHLLETKEELLFGESIEKYAYHTLQLLLKYKILNLEEIKHFEGKIKISYTLACDETHGSFKYRPKGDGTRVPEGIEILISLCKPLAEGAVLQEHIQHVLVHELGHYLYFFRDENNKKFDTICWNEQQKLCKKSDFYSEYSEENKEEDYAESFAFWFAQLNGIPEEIEQEHWSALGKWINEKNNYFNNFYKRLQTQNAH